MIAPVFLTARSKLRGDDAVAAILVLEDGRYVMQLRDPIPKIFYPDHWGCFGGAVNAGEDPLDALHRELQEELEFRVEQALPFTRFDFDFSGLGQKKVFRIYYTVPVTQSAFADMRLHEGADVRAFTGMELLQQPRVTPYDAFVIWLHFQRDRFS
jgi:8-oxo-dGTP pyrophosphatase MutT (NUDIX family)